MRKFILIATNIYEQDGQVNVKLSPSDDQINDYVAAYKIYPNLQDAEADTSNFIAEQTPLLFNTFLGMENVPTLTRNNYTL